MWYCLRSAPCQTQILESYSYDGILQSDWLLLRLSTANQCALFQHSTVMLLYKLFMTFKPEKHKFTSDLFFIGKDPEVHLTKIVIYVFIVTNISTLQVSMTVVVAQLVEQSLPIPEVCGLNPVISKNYYILNICLLSTVYWKDEN